MSQGGGSSVHTAGCSPGWLPPLSVSLEGAKAAPPPLALQPSACEIMWGPFTSEASSPVGLPESSPIGLQRQMLWGIVFPDPQAGESNMGLRTHCSERTSTV